MNTQIEGREAFADAAGLLLAAVTEDDGAVRALLGSLLEQRDFFATLQTLQAVLSVATMAIGAEVKRTAEEERSTTPSIELLVVLTSLAQG